MKKWLFDDRTWRAICGGLGGFYAVNAFGSLLIAQKLWGYFHLALAVFWFWRMLCVHERMTR